MNDGKTENGGYIQQKLKEYGLFPLINYNPNQLTLFDLDINQELNNNESQC